jgi:hypothetical protein
VTANPGSVELPVFHERNWSTEGSFEYGQWLAGAVIKNRMAVLMWLPTAEKALGGFRCKPPTEKGLMDNALLSDEPRTVAEHAVERILFGCRWLLAPFYLGLAISLVVLLIKFA